MTGDTTLKTASDQLGTWGLPDIRSNSHWCSGRELDDGRVGSYGTATPR